MKIVLCNVPMRAEQDRSEYGLSPNLAINSLITYAKKHGFECDYYNIDFLLPSDKEIQDYFRERKPDIVGISAVLSPTYNTVKHLVSLIRDASKDSFIILGGNLAYLSDLCLKKIGVDSCVIGEGEKAFVSLIKNKTKGVHIGEPVSGSEYPLPDYTILSNNNPHIEHFYFIGTHRTHMFTHDPRSNGHNGKVAIIQTSKGCVGACSFCQRFCKGYKTMDLDQIESHIKTLKEKYGITLFYITDECFGADKKHTAHLLTILKKHDILWTTGARVGQTKEELQSYYDAGCVNLKYGIESGSQQILTIINKGSTVEKNIKALKDCYDIGIFSQPSLLLGMPSETDSTIIESGRFLGDFCKYVGVSPIDIGCSFYFATPYPGTPLYEYGVLNGCFCGSIEEEERFLQYMENRTLNKMNFINLTGEPIKTVFFWDYLCILEALRTYYTGFKDKKTKNMPWTVGGEQEDVFKKIIRRFPPTLNMILFTTLPRWFLYPIVRELLYLLNTKKIKPFRLNNTPDRLTVIAPLKTINNEIKKNRGKDGNQML